MLADTLCPFCGHGRGMDVNNRPAYICGTIVTTVTGNLSQSDRCKMLQERSITQKQREMDEARTACVDALPKLWYGFYQGCMREGFTSEQAMRLVIAFITKPVSKEE